MDETTSIIRKQVHELPRELWEAIQDPGTEQAMRTASARYHLNSEQQTALANEVYFVLFGLDSFDDFPRNAQREMHITTQVSVPLVQEIQKQILYPVQHAISEFNQAQVAEEEEVEPPEQSGDVVNTPRYIGDEPEDKEQHSEKKTQPFSTDPYRELPE